MKERTVVLHSAGESSWSSVRTIAANLATAYRGASKPGARFLGYSDVHVISSGAGSVLSAEGWALVEKIRRLRPARLVFIDDLPHPAPLLMALAKSYGTERLPRVLIHAFGDFTLKIEDWLAAETELRRFDLKWVCASDRHAKLLSRLFAEPRRALGVIPFPVDESVFRFDSRLRADWRERQGISKDERVILYTGRLSLQKNIATLLRAAGKVIADARRPTRLFLAGTVDDLGSHILDIQYPEGFYFAHLQRVLEELPQAARERIVFLGGLKAPELNAVCNASDLYVSLSLHHDEDFGMAPAEALCAGIPAVLTNWGGYSSLGMKTDACSYLRLSFKEGYPVLDENKVAAEIARRLAEPVSLEARREWSRFYRSRFGRAAAGRLLAREASRRLPRFSGFNAGACRQVRALVSANIKDERLRKKTYEAVYGVYRK